MALKVNYCTLSIFFRSTIGETATSIFFVLQFSMEACGQKIQVPVWAVLTFLPSERRKSFQHLCNFPSCFESLEPGFFKSPGLGYWIWKPLIIHQALKDMPRSREFLIYSDIGCTVNSAPASSRRLQEYMEIASLRGVVTFSLLRFSEEDWTKPEVLEHFNAPPEARSSDQRIATIIVFRIHLQHDSWYTSGLRPQPSKAVAF